MGYSIYIIYLVALTFPHKSKSAFVFARMCVQHIHAKHVLRTIYTVQMCFDIHAIAHFLMLHPLFSLFLLLIWNRMCC
jgi:hypothetical protein